MQWTDVTATPSKKMLRQFAALWLVFFVSIGIWSALRDRAQLATVLVTLGLVVGALGMIRPAAIRLIYSGWMIAAFPIGWTISQIILAALFYGIFTPFAVVFRLIKRDSLRLRRRDDVDTYWTPKPRPSDVRDYFRQF